MKTPNPILEGKLIILSPSGIFELGVFQMYSLEEYYYSLDVIVNFSFVAHTKISEIIVQHIDSVGQQEIARVI
tara:strand:+ start:133 stop:351 length:219 start_codon:yes stop_codon:yes gene_type:complete